LNGCWSNDDDDDERRAASRQSDAALKGRFHNGGRCHSSVSFLYLLQIDIFASLDFIT
jgi:hypothetical protein